MEDDDYAKKQEEAEFEVILKEAQNKLFLSLREIMSYMLSMMKVQFNLNAY